MAEWRMAKIMNQRQSLGEILIDVQRSRQSPRNLPHLQRMGQPCSKMIVLVVNKDLRLVHQAAKSVAVDDPIAIALKI